MSDSSDSMPISQRQLYELVLLLGRECAVLHGQTESILAVVEELRVLDPRLDGLKPDETQKQAWHEFLAKVEDLNPWLAAQLDNRPKCAL